LLWCISGCVLIFCVGKMIKMPIACFWSDITHDLRLHLNCDDHNKLFYIISNILHKIVNKIIILEINSLVTMRSANYHLYLE
jgi:hypothetical protein